jgi:hypothetical protein
MTWLSIDEYNSNDVCPICHEEYGTTQAIYKTECGHIFHNNCLNDYCEHYGGNIVCPICRANIGENACMDVWAFKNKALGRPNNDLYFRNNPHVQSIYNSQLNDAPVNIHGGRNHRQRSNRNHRTQRRLNKNKKSRRSRKTRQHRK